MDNKDYKIISTSEDTFYRSELESTLTALKVSGNNTLIRVIEKILEKPSVEKPAQHSGGPETDLFTVDIPWETAEEIKEILGDLEVGAVGGSGETTPLASHYASLLDRWHKYIESR